MRTITILIMLVFCHCHGLFAQSSSPDSVILKDRSFYIGFITEILPRDTVFIRSPLGSNYSIPVDQIERVYMLRPRLGKPRDY